MKEVKQISAEYIPLLYNNVTNLLESLGATGTYVLTGSGVYVGILKKLTEKDHPIHDLDLKLIPDRPLDAARVLTTLSMLCAKEFPSSEEYFELKGEPKRYDFTYRGIPVNVWLMLDPVRYDTIRLDKVSAGSGYKLDVDIPIENLDDIFLAKIKMNRPKDVKDIKTLQWDYHNYNAPYLYDDILHPWVFDSQRPMTDEEKRYVVKAEVIPSQFDGKSIMFTCTTNLDGLHRYGENKVYHYMSIDEHDDVSMKVVIGEEIPVDSIIWVKYKRYNSVETCDRVRIK